MRAKGLGSVIRNLLVFIVPFGYALFAGGFLPWFLAYVSLVLGLASYFTVRLGVRHLDASCDFSAKRLTAGDSLSMVVKFKRPRFLPLPWLKVSVQVPPRLQSSLPRAEHVTPLVGQREHMVTFQLRGMRRGRYTIGPMTLVGGDMFGLFSSVRTVPICAQISVHPHIAPVHGWLGGKQLDGGRQASGQSGSDSGSVYGVREYVRGDRISQIHWRATARTGRLQTKEYELCVTSEICVVPDMSQSSYTRENGEALFELGLSIAASLLHHTYLQHTDFSCVFHGDTYETTPRGCSLALLEHALDVLATASPSCASDFSQTLSRAAHDATPGTTLVVVSPCLTSSAAAVISNCVRRMRVEWFVPVSGSGRSEDVQGLLRALRQAGARVHLIASLADLSSLHEGGR
jgi:uncharacterized protein (DUF58 family)